MSFLWVNGEIREKNDVGISAYDHGLVTGDGLFEVIATYDGIPFAVTRHIARLKSSATGFYIPNEFLDKISWKSEIEKLLKKNNLLSARVRITVTTGDADLGSDRGASAPLIIIAAGPMPKVADKGALALVPWPRNERAALCGLKTTSYGENVKALYFAKQKNANEALFLNLQGYVCEGTGSNLFWISHGKLFTPSLATGCLAGITRAIVIERAKAKGLEVYEVAEPLVNLFAADAAFLTSTLREVQWLERVDEKTWSPDKTGIVEILKKDFSEFARKNLDP